MDETPLPLLPPPPLGAAGRRRLWLTSALALAWLGLHSAGVIADGGRLASDHVFTWAGVSAERLVERGALVPFLVERGEWQRLITGAAVVGQGAFSLLLALWVFLAASARLERAAGTARALLVLLAGTLVGAVTTLLLDAGGGQIAPAGWNLALAALGASVPLGWAMGGTQGRTLISGALAFLAISVVLLLLMPGGRGIDALAETAAFVAGAVTLALLGPARSARPPGRALSLLALGALALVLVCAARQSLQVAAEGGGVGRSLVQGLERAERAAQELFRAPDPTRVRAQDRGALGTQLDALEARAADAGAGEPALRAYLGALRPIATGDLRDSGAALVRLKSAFAAWRPHEERLRQGLDPRAIAPWR